MIICGIILFLFITEILFRIFYNKTYITGKKEKWKNNYIEPHPFLSFFYKRNSVIKTNKLLNYELCKNKYYSFVKPLKINNCGHFGDHFEENKNDNTLRIACLGNSTTANNIGDKSSGIDFCYPDMLQKLMQSKIDLLKKYSKVEVYNFGIGGWVCQDILIDFIFNVLRTNPDYIIFCHGFVDVPFHLMNGFENDYSHGRKNLGEVIKNIRYASYIPQISFWKLYEFLRIKLFGTGNVRDELIKKIRKQKINIGCNLDTLKYERDIIKNIFIICKYYGIKIIVSSYPFYNFDKTDLSNKIEQGVLIENENIKKLSEEFKTIFIDQNNIIPKSGLYFLDWVHFTPTGMLYLTENYSSLIIEDVNESKI